MGEVTHLLISLALSIICYEGVRERLSMPRVNSKCSCLGFRQGLAFVVIRLMLGLFLDINLINN